MTLHWIFLELFPVYNFCFHPQFKGYFLCEFCGITLLITVKQKKIELENIFYVDLNFFRQATHPNRGVLVMNKLYACVEHQYVMNHLPL